MYTQLEYSNTNPTSRYCCNRDSIKHAHLGNMECENNSMSLIFWLEETKYVTFKKNVKKLTIYVHCTKSNAMFSSDCVS